MTKKLWLTIGTVSSVFVPLATVVACSKDYSYSEEDQKLLAELDKESTKRKFEAAWMKEVYKEVYPGKDFSLTTFSHNTQKFQDDFTSTLKYFLTENLRRNGDYLSQILSRIAQNDKNIDINDKEKTGSAANQTARALGWDLSVNTVHNLNKKIEAIDNDVVAKIFYDVERDGATGDLIFNPDSIGEKHNILKSLITKSYLAITKAEYRDTFTSGYVDNPESARDLTKPLTEFYPLIKNSIQAKVGFEWKIDLDTANTAEFMEPGEEKKTFKELDDALVKTFQKNLKLSERNSVIPNGLTNIPDWMTDDPAVSEEDKYTIMQQGYKGVMAISGGLNTLSTLPSHMKKQTRPRVGWVYDSEVVTEFKIEKDDQSGNDKEVENDKEVVFIKDNTLSLTRVQMILPSYNPVDTAQQLEFKNPKRDDGTAETEHITWEIAMNALIANDPNMFEEALKYYTTRKTDGKDTAILIEITNSKIRDILLDKGWSFIKED